MAKAPSLFETAFDTYTVEGVLGEGGCGRVFAVKDTSGERHALKCLLPTQITAQKEKRFRNEVHFCQGLVHDNLVRVTDVGLASWGEAKTPFYVMPRYPTTLRALLKAGIPPERVLPVFSKVLDGVEAAHLLGVTHRDLKPENILCDATASSLVVADFGIAAFEEEIILTAVETRDTERLANFLYAAPEQRTRGALVDRRADVFALGLMLNEMYTGNVIHSVGYTRIETKAPAYAYLDGIVERMIHQEASARYGSIDEVKKDLIGHRNAFIARLELDAARKRIVPNGAPEAIRQVSIEGVDWKPGATGDQGKLVMRLNRVPDRGWVERFAQPRYGYTTSGEVHPAAVKFKENEASIGIYQANFAQDTLDRCKEYVALANRGYQEDINVAAVQKERQAREQLEREIAQAEKRDRILKGLKL